ncbi:MAG: hypothetical protein GXP16_15200, partial [Gammaproteobacteria bacterium]|nr:hypothetical protein [Gammaproteobacteria bacterium]
SATPPPILFKGIVESRRALQDVVASAKRRLLILNPHLDHLLFDYNEVVEALSKFARSAARVEVSILIMDSKLIVERGHQVLELARRLDGKIRIRKLNENANAKTSSFVCADFDSYWLMPNYDAYDGVLDLTNPVTNKRLTEVFVTAWEKSFEDPELRVLQI